MTCPNCDADLMALTSDVDDTTALVCPMCGNVEPSVPYTDDCFGELDAALRTIRSYETLVGVTVEYRDRYRAALESLGRMTLSASAQRIVQAALSPLTDKEN